MILSTSNLDEHTIRTIQHSLLCPFRLDTCKTFFLYLIDTWQVSKLEKISYSMNVNKKLGRFKQWAGERMGGEAKTNVSDDFKSLEVEMNLRHEGTIRGHSDDHKSCSDKRQAWSGCKNP